MVQLLQQQENDHPNADITPTSPPTLPPPPPFSHALALVLSLSARRAAGNSILPAHTADGHGGGGTGSAKGAGKKTMKAGEQVCLRIVSLIDMHIRVHPALVIACFLEAAGESCEGLIP